MIDVFHSIVAALVIAQSPNELHRRPSTSTSIARAASPAMQSTVATRRALHYLTSKIHPQLPLSPREQQQLLNILTTSFRAHLNRQHPLSPPEKEARSRTALVQHVPQPNTSQTAANKHIDSILANPLFSAPPRRGSDAAHAEVQDVFKDPLGWFMGQAAIGAADVSKAAACLTVLSQKKRSNDEHAARAVQTRPGTRIADWLWSSGLEGSRSFIGRPHSILPQLIPLLVEEGEENPIWRWMQQENDTLVQKTGLTVDQVLAFKARLLAKVVQVKLETSDTLDEALAAFAKAQYHTDEPTGARVLRHAGTSILARVLSDAEVSASPELYQTFLDKVRAWTGTFDRIMESLLWLRHPSKRSARPGLAYIKHAQGSHLLGLDIGIRPTKKRRELVVELCLGVARQSMAEHRFQDAQVALEFAKDHFPDMVLAPPAANSDMKELLSDHYVPLKMTRRISEEEKEKNLQMLDSLLPG
ncbi:hypothetical protein BDV96DRAFT_581586 [Lophiotrema nucula]|uniref:Uncharacterized protein n=1 Tax=Lophiotrema nucula TaxID=690887 RepID=A0A6A5YX17_9PLEO|nr:hypothetical protein BDV96DRAFT_581586 [Lophiotrema nucula]